MNNDLLDAAKRLAEVLTQENDALRRMDFTAAVAMVPAKEAALTELTRQPPPNAVPPPLAAVAQRLAGLATENQTLLQRAITVQTRIVQIVARACSPAPAAKPYGGRGERVLSTRAGALALSTRA